MSDSELSDVPSENLPSDSQIEAGLRNEVKKAVKSGDTNYSVSSIRKATESQLSLPTGFLTGDKWKPLSKTIIKDQSEQDNTAESPSSPPTHKPVGKTGKARDQTANSGKRASVVRDSRPVKKQKIDSEEETSALSSPPSDSEDKSAEDVAPKKPKGAPNKRKTIPPKAKSGATTRTKKAESDDEDLSDQDATDKAENKVDESESEMSEVLDEEPARKKRGKSTSEGAASKKAKGAKSKSKTNPELDPDQEEVKKLQGWLVKCGIRKVWGKELKPFETPKAKIKHLRSMLTDTGMTGRFSNEKAAQIKEARELAADIEAVQEGNERWGKSGDEDEEADGTSKSRGGRRLIRGAKNYDFLSSDGEETD